MKSQKDEKMIIFPLVRDYSGWFMQKKSASEFEEYLKENFNEKKDDN